MANDSDEGNVYTPPKAKQKPAKRFKRARTEDSTADDLAAIRIAFEKTRPWVAIFAVASYIGAGWLVFTGVIVGLTNSSKGIGVLPCFGGALIYVLMGRRLGRYRDSIRLVSQTEGRLDAIADAVENQQRLWLFIGFHTLIMLPLYAAGIAAAFILLWGPR
jgi:hypothetical protein